MTNLLGGMGVTNVLGGMGVTNFLGGMEGDKFVRTVTNLCHYEFFSAILHAIAIIPMAIL